MALGVTSNVAQLRTSAATHTTATLDTTGAAMVVIYIKYDSTAPASLTNWRDNKGNTITPTLLASVNLASQSNYAYCFPVSIVGSGHTVSVDWTNSAASETLFGAITCGAGNTIALDQGGAWNLDGAVPYLSNSITPTQSPSMAIGWYDAGRSAADTTIAAGNGFTLWGHVENGTVLQMAMLYQALSDLSAQQSSISASDFSGNTEGLVANFYEIVTAAYIPYNRWHQMGPIIAT